jgi:DUF438 domain-containing protein
MVCLKILRKSNLFDASEAVEKLSKECNELVSIFVKSIETAEKNNLKNTN